MNNSPKMSSVSTPSDEANLLNHPEKKQLAYETLPMSELSQQQDFSRAYLGEAIGTGILIFLGDGVSAIAHNFPPLTYGVWILICLGWGVAITSAICISSIIAQAGTHLNPVGTVDAVISSQLPAAKGVWCIIAQLLGAFCGGALLTVVYIAIQGNNELVNFYCSARLENISCSSMLFVEAGETFILMFGSTLIFYRFPKVAESSITISFVIGCMICFIGMTCSWWVKTFALNPARDLGPRLSWLMFEIIFQRSNLWQNVMGNGYFLVPIFGPLLGGLAAGHVSRRILQTPNKDWKMTSNQP